MAARIRHEIHTGSRFATWLCFTEKGNSFTWSEYHGTKGLENAFDTVSVISQVWLRFEPGAAAYIFQPFRLECILHSCPTPLCCCFTLAYESLVHSTRLSESDPCQIRVTLVSLWVRSESVVSVRSYSRVTLASLPRQIRVSVHS